MSVSLETSRLILRPITEQDFEFMTRLWSRPEIMQYLPTGQPRSQAAVRVEMDHMLAHWEEYGFGMWAITRKASPEMIGYCGLMYLHAEPDGVSVEVSAATREVEIVYGIEPAYWGQGLTREAASAAMRYAVEQLKLPRIVAAIHPENLASQRILEGLGMRPAPELHYYGECPHFIRENSYL